MKGLLTILVAIFITGYVQAQTTSGSAFFGGGINYSNSDETDVLGRDYEASNLNFNISAGYFVADQFSVGLNVGIGNSESGTYESKSFAVGPFARYYKITSNEKLAFFGQLEIAYFSTKEETDFGMGPVEFESNGFGAALSPGLAYFFNEHWSAEFSFVGIEYLSTKDEDTDDKRDMFRLGLNSLSPTIGLRYYF